MWKNSLEAWSPVARPTVYPAAMECLEALVLTNLKHKGQVQQGLGLFPDKIWDLSHGDFTQMNA